MPHALKALPNTLLEKSLEELLSIVFFIIIIFQMAALNCHCDSGIATTTATQRTNGCGSCFGTLDSIKAAHGSDSSFMAQYIILLEASIRKRP